MTCRNSNQTASPQMEPQRIGGWSSSFPPKPTWTSDQVPDLHGKVTIVTGGSSGIGAETARVLLLKGARVYIAARSKPKALKTVEELRKLTFNDQCFFLQLDLADLPQIRKSAEEFLAKENELHILFNNGGVMFPPLDQMTAQDYDVQFGTNVLGHFFFTKLLLPILLQTTKQNPDDPSRIVNVTSNGMDLLQVPGGINFESLQKGEASLKARKKLGPMKLYGQSKLGNVIFTKELARRYGKEGLISHACHPGSIKSDLQRHSGTLMRKFMDTFVLKSVEYGAITPLFCGTAPDARSTNGVYFAPYARAAIPNNPGAHDPDLAVKMWDWCEEQCKDF